LIAKPVQLAFPLRDGWYYVGQGGNTPMMNQHNSNRAQRYAVDFTALDRMWVRANGVYPADLKRYTIFGAPVVSLCDGTVLDAVDGLPDLTPPAADRENLAGNHVVIACNNAKVLLAHLKQNGVQVQQGDQVALGQALGTVGNSGNTTEPHLHIHAVRADAPSVLEGEGLPILFDGVFPVRNSTFRR
jgi:hypothetical protein